MDKQDKTDIPQLVQHRIRQLVYQESKGIWGSELEHHFRKHYKVELEYQEYGCASILEFCTRLPHILAIRKHIKRNFKVFDIRNPIPTNLIHKEDLKYHAGVVTLQDKINYSFLVPTIEHVNVNICDVYDPSKFWFHTEESATELNSLNTRVQSFYTASKDYYRLKTYQLQVGLYCSAKWRNQYHRGIIVNILEQSENLIKVFFIDYGTTDYVNIDSVYFLHECFKKPPALSLRGSLANVQPKGTNMPWSLSAINHFSSIINAKYLNAKIVNIDFGVQNVYTLTLTEEASPHNMSVNEKMIMEGYAVDSTCKQDDAASQRIFLDNRQKMHLVPSFDELERGSFPNYKQVKICHQEGHSIETLYAKYLTAIR